MGGGTHVAIRMIFGLVMVSNKAYTEAVTSQCPVKC
jgi:hypothetical protein